MKFGCNILNTTNAATGSEAITLRGRLYNLAIRARFASNTTTRINNIDDIQKRFAELILSFANMCTVTTIDTVNAERYRGRLSQRMIDALTNYSTNVNNTIALENRYNQEVTDIFNDIERLIYTDELTEEHINEYRSKITQYNSDLQQHAEECKNIFNDIIRV